MRNTKSLSYEYGIKAEKLVISYLRSFSHQILHTRYKTKYGEIDIVAQDGSNKKIIFCEVKARRSRNIEIALESIVTPTQQKRISNAALYFISQEIQYQDWFMQFDVIIVNNGEIIDHIQNAW